MKLKSCFLLAFLLWLTSDPLASGIAAERAERTEDIFVVDGCPNRPGTGKKVVLVSGDEEYRSEEVLPQLAKILSQQHGFDCVVLFAINPETQQIDPNFRHHIPGLQHLQNADVMVIATRFRDLPDKQMRQIDHFLRRGGSVVGMRTATHGFNIPVDKNYAHYGNGYQGEKEFWRGGFGRAILGEKWISHHGSHRHESTRGLIAVNEKK